MLRRGEHCDLGKGRERQTPKPCIERGGFGTWLRQGGSRRGDAGPRLGRIAQPRRFADRRIRCDRRRVRTARRGQAGRLGRRGHAPSCGRRGACALEGPAESAQHSAEIDGRREWRKSSRPIVASVGIECVEAWSEGPRSARLSSDDVKGSTRGAAIAVWLLRARPRGIARKQRAKQSRPRRRQTTARKRRRNTVGWRVRRAERSGPGIAAAARRVEGCAGADHGAGGEAGTAGDPAGTPPVTRAKKAFARRSSAAGSGMKVPSGTPLDILLRGESVRRVSRRHGCNRGNAQSPHHRAPPGRPRSRRRASNRAR